MTPTISEEELESRILEKSESLKMVRIRISSLRKEMSKAEEELLELKLDLIKAEEELQRFREMFPDLCRPREM